MPHPTAKIRRFYGALRGAKLTAHKEALLEGYGATSLNDLTAEQLDELLAKLDTMQDSPERRRLMSVNIGLLEDLGIYVKPNPWPRVNNYVRQARIGGKEMYRMTLLELKQLAKKLRAILTKEREAAELERSIDKVLEDLSAELDAGQYENE